MYHNVKKSLFCTDNVGTTKMDCSRLLTKFAASFETSSAFQTTNIEQLCDPNLSSQRTGHAAGLLRCKGRSNMRSPLTNEWQEGFTMLI